MNLSFSVLAFCRMVMGLLFLLSLIGKLRNVSAFQQTVEHFYILPASLAPIATYLVLGTECLIVLCMLYGGIALLPGFLFAGLSLVLFSYALVTVLRRNMQIACNCFGVSEKVVTPADIWRNAGFLLCVLSGGITLLSGGSQPAPDWMSWVLPGIGACAFVALWSQVGDIMDLLQSLFRD